jgi:DnaJ-class molecular chaperone
MSKTPYEILGVPVTASQDDIKDAYRKLAKKFHPDLNPGNKDAEKNFKELTAANELIGTLEARAQFDRGESSQDSHAHAGSQGRQGPYYHQTQQEGGRYSRSFEGMDDDFLHSIFGQMGGRARRQSVDMPGEDVLYQMDIDFKDSVLGAEREITLPTGKRLRVKIPQGIESGMKLRFTGQGGPGRGKGASGDAYVQLNVRSSRLFKREKNDLEIELPISLSEAVLGAEVKVPTIDGHVMLKIPGQVSSGQRLRVAGKGVPSGEGKRGDQFVVLKIHTPQQYDDEFKKAVDSWSKRQPFDPRADWDGVRGDAS